MSTLTTVLVAPITTEKSAQAAAHDTSVFRVARTATKTEVKDAVEKLYGVKVVAVRTQVRPMKTKMRGRHPTQKRPEMKLAFIKTAKGTSLDPNKITATTK